MKKNLLYISIGLLVAVFAVLLVLVLRGRGDRPGAGRPSAVIENCESIQDLAKQAACWRDQSVAKNDVSVCAHITDPLKRQICESLAWSSLAFKNRDMNACLKIPLDQYRGCFAILLQNADEKYCAQLPKPYDEKCGIIVKSRK